MAEVAALRPDHAPAALETFVSGKLVDERVKAGVYYSEILAPAADEYAHPVPLEVRSDRAIGRRGDVVTVRCAVGGFRGRQYDLSDKQTGEVRRVKPIVMTLWALN